MIDSPHLLYFSGLYRLRERNPSDLPNPIPPGCDREEKKKRVEKEGSMGKEERDRRERRREERLEPEQEWRKRKEREARENKENVLRRGDGRQMRRHTSHKREWRESFATKKDTSGFGNADSTINGGSQPSLREKRRMSTDQAMVDLGKVSSPRKSDMKSPFSRPYTGQERGENMKLCILHSTSNQILVIVPQRARIQ